MSEQQYKLHLGPEILRSDSRLASRITRHALRNWPEYLIEAWALGMFMVSACAFTVWFEHPDSWVRMHVLNGDVRRLMVGIAMGLTAVSLIYSPWGQRSGAHMNPAVTLAFMGLGKVHRIDAAFYVLFQFIGGTLGVLAMAWLFGDRIADAAVNFAVTAPPMRGTGIAFIAEFVISFLMMSMVLRVSNSQRWQKFTGVCAGVLVATFITFEAPFSGMSMNPARSFASALPSGHWMGFWIYVVAPIAAMQLAAAFHVAFGKQAHCGKLLHPDTQRCIHCGYDSTPDVVRDKVLQNPSTHSGRTK